MYFQRRSHRKCKFSHFSGKCFFSNYAYLKMLIHTYYNGFCSGCVCSCLFRVEPAENADPHFTQENYYTRVYVCMCVLKYSHCENTDPQT